MQEKIEEDAKELERMASKQTVLQQKIQECTKKIRELGSLPSDTFDKYKNVSEAIVQTAGEGKPGAEEVQPREQKSFGSVCVLL